MTLKKAAQKFWVSVFTLSCWLKRLGYSYKKRLFVRESNQRKAKSASIIDQYIACPSLVYIDESSIDRLCAKTEGWGRKSEKLVGKKSGKWYQRTNSIAGLVNNTPIAPRGFNGSCEILLFQAWVEKFLIKKLKPGQGVIMDSASFHKSKRSRELIEFVKWSIIFLPPYTPDLNPIKKFWANMKRGIECNILNFKALFDAIPWFFKISNST
ncbi:hypothetical protein HE1_00960 [Holospora elegans E1]|uniref:Tc1-like transposase DDE domain-containing protein n=2 Tax=Holospora TaxID=44747 RepID=A0A023DZS3_9PROT|nr:transposase [Holospora elegans]GAJ46623.1 hypothetical protein HE1_00960 [Holospora elegans E1]